MVFPNRKIKVNIQLVFQEFVFFFPLGQAVTRIFYGNKYLLTVWVWRGVCVGIGWISQDAWEEKET